MISKRRIEKLASRLMSYLRRCATTASQVLAKCEEVAAGLQAGGALGSDRRLADLEPKYAKTDAAAEEPAPKKPRA